MRSRPLRWAVRERDMDGSLAPEIPPSIRLCARSSGSEANAGLISARGPTATMVPTPSTTTAASAMAGLAMGKTQGALINRAGCEPSSLEGTKKD
jgi:hypothetical protein